MDANITSSNESVLRYLGFLVENRNDALHELADLSSSEQSHKSIEDSLQNSVYFYKTQLEKAEIQNKQLCLAIHQIEELCSLKINKLSEDLSKKIESEQILIQNSFHLQTQLEFEINLRKNAEESDKNNRLKLKATVLQFSKDTAKFIKEKQTIHEKYINDIEHLTQKLEQRQGEILELKECLSVKELKVEKYEFEDAKIIVPLVDESVLSELSAKVNKYQIKYKSLKEQNKKLKDSIDQLLSEVEIKVPLLTSNNENYEKLLLRYNELSKNYESIKSFSDSNNENIEKCTASLKKQSTYILELNEKCSVLSKEVYNLMIENHNLQTKDTSPLDCRYIEAFIKENTELKLKFRKLEDEFKSISLQFSSKDLTIKDLNEKIINNNKTIDSLHQRLGLVEKLDEYRNHSIINFQAENLKLEIEENKILSEKYKTLYELSLNEFSDLQNKYNESIDNQKKLNIENNELKKEIIKLQLSNCQKSITSNPTERYTPIALNISEYLEDYEKKLSEFLQDRKEANETIMNLQRENLNANQKWSEEFTKLNSENNLLKLKCNISESDKLREELGKSRRRLREIKYLLEINEKELKDEKLLRAQAENRLKKLRKSLQNKEKASMSICEIQSQNKQINMLNRNILDLSDKNLHYKEILTSKENEYFKDTENLKHMYMKEKESNEIHQQHIKSLIAKLTEMNAYTNKGESQTKNFSEKLNDSKFAQFDAECLDKNPEALHKMIALLYKSMKKLG